MNLFSFVAALLLALVNYVLFVFSASYVVSVIYNDSYIFATLPRFNTFHFVPAFLIVSLFKHSFKMKEKKEKVEGMEAVKFVAESYFNYIVTPWIVLFTYKLILLIF